MHVSAVVHPELEISVCTDLIAFTVVLLLLQAAVCNSKGRVYSARSCSSKALVYSCLTSWSFILSCSFINDFSKLPYSLLHPLWLLQHIQLISLFLPLVVSSSWNFVLLYFFFFKFPLPIHSLLFPLVATSCLGYLLRHFYFCCHLFIAAFCPAMCSPSFLVLSSYVPETWMLKCCFHTGFFVLVIWVIWLLLLEDQLLLGV